MSYVTNLSQDRSKVCSVVFEILKISRSFSKRCVTMSLLVECMTGVPKEPGSIPGWGEFFHLNSF